MAVTKFVKRCGLCWWRPTRMRHYLTGQVTILLLTAPFRLFHLQTHLFDGIRTGLRWCWMSIDVCEDCQLVNQLVITWCVSFIVLPVSDILLIRRRRYQQQLMNVILQLFIQHPDIHYYQGLHDIVLTFLLTVGDTLTYAIMDVLVQHHLRWALCSHSLLKWRKLLQRFFGCRYDSYTNVHFISQALVAFNGSTIRRIHYQVRTDYCIVSRELFNCVHRSQCYYFFSLSWVITWFGHVIHDNSLVARLVDVFLASHPLMPIYLSAMVRLIHHIYPFHYHLPFLSWWFIAEKNC